MKNFSIQSFTLMMMMTVSSAAVPNPTTLPHNGTTGFDPKSLLKQIRLEASNLMNSMSSELKNTTVMFPTECSKEFFCLAEKSLNSTSLVVVKKLTGLVEGYNKVKIVHCTGVTTNRRLSKLVEQIEHCSKMKVKA